MRKVSFIVVVLISLGALVVTSHGPERNIPSHPTASDVRHVEISGARVRISQGEGYIDGGVMPRFTTVRVLRTSSDSKFIVAETGDGRTITIAASALATGDGAQAKARWCDQQVQSPQLADRVMKRLESGPNQVTVKNLGGDDAVAQFRGADGRVALSLFVAQHSSTRVSDFPDGRFRLEFATGREWNSQCNTFRYGMRSRQFPGFDQFMSTGTRYKVAEYTITPVRDGNINAELLDSDVFSVDVRRPD